MLMASVALLLTAFNGVVDGHGIGTGAPISAALCAVVAAAVFGLPLCRAAWRGRLTLTDSR